jgi:predicted PolB exonuclease-like 3'-5' exonuclease
METNYNIQTGRLVDENGKNFDITVILNFPTKADYAAASSLDDFPAVNMIDFYFGEQNDRDTSHYVDQFVEKQNKLRSLYTKLVGLSATCPNDTELAEQIDFVKSLIVTLH